MFRVVLFDIDGTLLHTGGAGVKAFARAFATEFGITDGTERLKFAGRTDVSLVREFFGHNQIEASPENFRRDFEAYIGWLEKLIPDCRGGVCKGVVEFYDALHALPVPPLVGLLTGNIKRGAQIKLSRYDWWDRFQFGGFADDHEDRDQIAAPARQRASALAGPSLQDHEVLVIGDTPHDIRCARAINAKVLAVGTGGFTAKDLAAFEPDWFCEDLSQA